MTKHSAFQSNSKYMMTLWHGNASHTVLHLVGRTSEIPLKKDPVMRDFDVFLVKLKELKQIRWQTDKVTRRACGAIVNQVLPINTCVPRCYVAVLSLFSDLHKWYTTIQPAYDMWIMLCIRLCTRRGWGFGGWGGGWGGGGGGANLSQSLKPSDIYAAVIFAGPMPGY